MLQIVYILFIIFFFFQVIVGVQADETTIEPFFETVGHAGEKTFNKSSDIVLEFLKSKQEKSKDMILTMSPEILVVIEFIARTWEAAPAEHRQNLSSIISNYSTVLPLSVQQVNLDITLALGSLYIIDELRNLEKKIDMNLELGNLELGNLNMPPDIVLEFLKKIEDGILYFSRNPQLRFIIASVVPVFNPEELQAVIASMVQTWETVPVENRKLSTKLITAYFIAMALQPSKRQAEFKIFLISVLPSLASLFREILGGVSGLLARNKEFIVILICVVIFSVVKFLLTLVREVASIFFSVTFIAILICVVICSIVAGLLILVCDIFFSVTMLLLSETIRTMQTVSRYLEDSWDDQQKPKRD